MEKRKSSISKFCEKISFANQFQKMTRGKRNLSKRNKVFHFILFHVETKSIHDKGWAHFSPTLMHPDNDKVYWFSSSFCLQMLRYNTSKNLTILTIIHIFTFVCKNIFLSSFHIGKSLFVEISFDALELYHFTVNKKSKWNLSLNGNPF